MTNVAQLQKHVLECLRLESACTELAVRVHDPLLRLHFTRMAKVWNGLAEDGLAGDTATNRLPAIRAA
jgi:hypothetical protein